MTSQVLVAALSAVVAVLTTLVTVLYGPTWKARLDRRREREDRSERLLARYSEPLVRAAYDLASRLYNLVRQRGAEGLAPDSSVEFSTLWLFGQFFAWVEILRREVQVLDLGDVRRTSQLQVLLYDISDVLASSRNIADPVFNIVRADQRAIGERMVVDRSIDGQTRSDSMGFASFKQRMHADPEFSAWFDGMRSSFATLTDGAAGHVRSILLQRSLIDLIDFLDFERVRFPDPNERGRIPLPRGVEQREGRKQVRPPGQIARFRFNDGDPWAVVDNWQASTRNTSVVSDEDGTGRHVRLATSVLQVHRWYLTISWEDNWIEISLARAWVISRRVTQTQAEPPRAARKQIDELLRLLDRPLTFWP